MWVVMQCIIFECGGRLSLDPLQRTLSGRIGDDLHIDDMSSQVVHMCSFCQ